MFGVGIALLTAVAWAGSSVIMKLLAAKIDALSINTLRLWTGSLILLIFIPLSGRWGDFIHTPLGPLIYVIGSGVIGLAIGDSIYIKSLSILDASMAFPIAQCSFIIITVLAAVIFLGEPFGLLTWVGSGLVVLGIYLIAAMGKDSDLTSEQATISGKGILLTLAAAAIWTISTIMLKIGAMGIDPFVVAGYRIPASAIVISILAISRRKKGTLQFRQYNVRSIALALTAGLLTYGLAAVGYVKAIQLIGAGKTVLLTTTAPIFVVPFSILFLKERPSRYTLAGVLLCVAGICLVVS